MVAELELALRAPQRDVGEPPGVAVAQPRELVEVVRIALDVAVEAVRLVAGGERLAPACARGRGRRLDAELAISDSERVRYAIAASASEAASASRPARSQNAAAARELAAALEVLGDHGRRLLATGEEPRREQPADPRVAVALRTYRQRLVDHLAHEAARVDLDDVPVPARDEAGGDELVELAVQATLVE